MGHVYKKVKFLSKSYSSLDTHNKMMKKLVGKKEKERKEGCHNPKFRINSEDPS
jgi:hypothetical protein